MCDSDCAKAATAKALDECVLESDVFTGDAVKDSLALGTQLFEQLGRTERQRLLYLIVAITLEPNNIIVRYERDALRVQLGSRVGRVQIRGRSTLL